jgi:hypothetical protein
MNSSKLYSILEYFNKYEQNSLRKYLLSPYFNKNQTLVELFEILLKNINAKNPKELTKELIWKKLIKIGAYDDVRFRKHFSDLLKLVEGFLAQQVFEENPVVQATYLIDAVGRKKMEKLYNSTMKSARRLSEQQLYRSASYYYYQYQVEKNYFDLAESEHDRTAKRNVEDIVNNLDRFYLAEKLKFYCHVLSQQYVTSHEYKVLFIEEIIDHLKNYNYHDAPAIEIYLQIYLTQKEHENNDHYHKLKELIDTHGNKFPNSEAEFFYSSAMNYCIRKVNQGNQNFLNELFELYKGLIQTELIFVDGELSPWNFKNIVSCALRLGKYKWTEDFINNYNKYIPDDFRANAVSFNLAQLYFYQKEYNKVIELIQTVEYEDFTYNLNSKLVLMMIYYETDEIEPLYFLTESFRAYLNRHKDIPESRKKGIKDFIKFTRKLTKIRPRDKKELLKLKEEIDMAKGTFSANWLKEKIAELE